MAGATVPMEVPDSFPGRRDLVLAGVRYRLGHQVGRGAFSTVYRASDEWGNRLVAKVYRADLAPETWRNEARMLERLRHPNLVHLHGSIELDGCGYLLLSYGGIGVGRLLPQTPVQRLAVARVVAQGMLQALHHIHAAGCVHADVSPGNVLVDRRAAQARVTLCDLGLCFDVADPPSRLKLPDWSPPPERLLPGRPGAVSPAMDVYAAAMLLLQVLCGTQDTSFDADEIRAGRPAASATALGTPLGDALASALAPAPAERPSALELWRRLQRAFPPVQPRP
ncbi:MAG TPA: protein kinase [Quisquiliibacterium sp.]|nr:protein kinase [Quisquiliibacterium sp.]